MNNTELESLKQEYNALVTRCAKLMLQNDELLKIARHTHVNNQVKGDSRCTKCGLDLRHVIHHTQP